MDDHHLRSIILQLQDRLTDHDRERLHFFLLNHVPRTIGDDHTLSGTLNLMQSLFDQNKINEQDFTLLINAFTEIRCLDAVRILLDHRKRMQSCWLTQPNLRFGIPPLNEEISQDQEDKSSSECCKIGLITNYAETIKVFDSNNTTINPMIINVDNKKILSSKSEQNKPFYTSLKVYKYFLFMILLLLIISGILITIFIVTTNKDNTVCRKIKTDFLTEQSKHNKTMQSLNNLVLEKDQQIEELKNEVRELNKENDASLIKAGKKFGDSDGDYFDDSTLEKFTCSHYLNGLLVRSDENGSEAYQFFYRSPGALQNKIKSDFHGNENFEWNGEHTFYGNNVKINKVEGQIITRNIASANGTNVTKTLITGLRFTSTEDVDTPLYLGPSGTNFHESFPGYILGYVSGKKSDQYIEEIRFHWYREHGYII